MIRIYRGTKVESSIPLDSALFYEPEEKKPTPVSKKKVTRKKETK